MSVCDGKTPAHEAILSVIGNHDVTEGAEGPITYPTLQGILSDYGRAERRVADSLNSMMTSGARRVVLWGNTNITELVLKLIAENGHRISVVGVVEPTGRHPRTIDVSVLPALNLDAVVVCEPGANGMPEGIRAWRLV